MHGRAVKHLIGIHILRQNIDAMDHIICNGIAHCLCAHAWRANKVRQIPAMCLHLHSPLAALKILSVLPVAPQTPLECDSRVECNNSVRVCKPSVARCDIRVAPRAISLVPDRLCIALNGSELFRSLGRTIDVRQKVPRSVLFARLIHGVKATIVIVDVGVTATTVHFVSQTVPVVGKVCYFGLGRGL